MAASIHPPWVYDLILAAERYEDEHGVGYTCLAPALVAVPPKDREMATVLAAYKAQLRMRDLSLRVLLGVPDDAEL